MHGRRIYRRILGVLPLLSLTTAHGATYFDPDTLGVSSRQTTLGVGSLASSNDNSSGLLSHPSSGASNPQLAIESGLATGRLKTNYANPASGKYDTTLQQTHILGVIPLTSLANAKNPSGFGISTGVVVNKIDGNEAPKSSNRRQMTQSRLSAFVGISDLVVGLDYRVGRLSSKDRYSFTGSDFDNQQVQTAVKADGSSSMRNFGAYLRWDGIPNMRLALAYSPRKFQTYERKSTSNSINLVSSSTDTFVDTDRESIGELETTVLAMTYSIPNTPFILVSGAARQTPYNHRYGDNGSRSSSEYRGSSHISVGMEANLTASLKPRVGVKNVAQPYGWLRRLGIGADFAINKVIITADAGYAQARWNSDEFSGATKWRGVDGAVGIGAWL